MFRFLCFFILTFLSFDSLSFMREAMKELGEDKAIALYENLEEDSSVENIEGYLSIGDRYYVYTFFYLMKDKLLIEHFLGDRSYHRTEYCKVSLAEFGNSGQIMLSWLFGEDLYENFGLFLDGCVKDDVYRESDNVKKINSFIEMLKYIDGGQRYVDLAKPILKELK